MVVLTGAEMENLRTIYNNAEATHPAADFYRALANIMDGTFPYPDAPPAEYLTAIQWLRGAAEVNENSGSQSDFIRSYNKAQVEARYGETLSDSEMDAVSNAIADRIFRQIVGSSDNPGTGAFPTIDSLARDDAAPAAATIFHGDLGGWAGNHLFLVLGHYDSFYSNIMEAGSTTYDAVAMIKFTNENFGTENWWDAFAQFLSYPPGAVTYLSAMTDLDGFIIEAYSCVPHSSHLSGRTLISSFDNIVLGLVEQADTLAGTAGRDLIQGGGGADTILGSLGADILDGAEGKDVVDYSNFDGDRIFTLTGAVQSTADYVGYVTGTGASDILQASLFGIERIVAGAGDDEFRIESLPGILERIDGGGQGEKGDTLDLSDLTSNAGAVIVLQDEEGTAGSIRVDLSQIAVDSFENVIGSGKNDSIKGSAEANVIQGDGGDDTIDGGGGADLLAGGDGADTFDVNLSGATGPAILWGGAGADTFNFSRDPEVESSPLKILTVNVSNLSEENFATIDLNMLGMEEGFDWSKVDAVILNPDSGDRVTVDGDLLGTRSYHYAPLVYPVLGGWDTEPVEVDALAVTYDAVVHGGDFSNSGYVGGVADYYKTSFFGVSDMSVFAGVGYYSTYENIAFDNDSVEEYDYDWEEYIDASTVDYIFTDYMYDGVDSDLYMWVSISGPGVDGRAGVDLTSVTQIPSTDNQYDFGAWAIIGGRFDGTQLVATHSVTLPGNEEALLS